MPYLVTEPKALLFVPLYAFIAPFILLPYRLYAMLTARNTSWLTRGNDGKSKGKEKGTSIVRGVVIGTILFAVCSFPRASIVLACGSDEYDCY